MKQVAISKIKPNPNNPRTISDDKLDKLVQSIKDFPKMLEMRPIVVDNEMTVLGGNMRLKACIKAGLKKVHVIVADELTEDQKKEFIIKDNSSFGEWDWPELQNNWDLDVLEGWGLDTPIDWNQENKELEEDSFNEPESIETDIVVGDLITIGSHRLICGDSTDEKSVRRLMNNRKADMVFTDPPYGIDYSGGRSQLVNKKAYGKLINDDLEGVDLGNLISNVFNFNKKDADVYICVSPIMQKPFLDFINDKDKAVNAVIVWDKKVPGLGYMSYRRQCEFILFVKGGKFKKGDTSDFDLWSISRDAGKNYVHGTQKPVQVSGRAISNSSKKEDIVLDYFCGSGSTMVACHKLERSCYASELDPKYCQVIVNRMLELDPGLEVTINGLNMNNKN